MATHSNSLVWIIPWTEEGPDGLYSTGSQRSQTRLKCLPFSSVVQSCLTLCNPMDCSTPGFPEVTWHEINPEWFILRSFTCLHLQRPWYHIFWGDTIQSNTVTFFLIGTAMFIFYYFNFGAWFYTQRFIKKIYTVSIAILAIIITYFILWLLGKSTTNDDDVWRRY